MNKIYKSIWNTVTRSWTAVSEAQRAHGKCSKKVAVSIALLGLSFFNASAMAATWDVWPWSNEIHLTDTKGIGQGSEVQTYDDLTVYEDNSRTLFLNDGGVSINADGNLSSQLFTQSYGTDFQIVKVNDDFRMFIGVQGKNFSVKNEDGSSGYTQGLKQGEDVVANATYLIGEEAKNFLVKHLNYAVVESSDDSRINFNGNLYSSTGINYRGNRPLVGGTADTSNGIGFWSLAVLRNIELLSTLQLSASSDSSLAANITGDGSINFISSSSQQAKVTLEGILSDDANSYTGETEVNNVWLVLNKNNSLGSTSKLTATNSAVVEVNQGTETVGQLVLENSTLKLNTNTFNVGEKGAVIDATSQVTGSQATLAVNNGDLTVQSQNGDLKNSQVSANNITVNYTDAFGEGTSSTATEKYVFDGVVGTQVNSISAKEIVLKKKAQGKVSNVIYDDKAQITTSSTLIQDGSQLEVTGISQLGANVALNNGGDALADYNKLTIKHTSELTSADSGTWSLGDLQFVSDNANAIVEVTGSGIGDSDPWFNISNTDRWVDYVGWLRISNTNFELDTTLAKSVFNLNDGASSVGLSIGAGGQVYVSPYPVSIDRFGWASNDSDAANGVLDFTKVEQLKYFIDDPLLTVNQLHMQGNGTIRLNAKDYLDLVVDSALTDGSVLDFQEGDAQNRAWLISAKEVVGDGLVTLDDTSDSQDITVAIYNSFNDQDPAAKGTWGYGTQLVKEGQQQGVCLTYVLKELELLGVKDPTRALDINLKDSEQRDLHIKVTGEGILQIDADGATETDIALTNEGNKFAGLVDVLENVQLTAKQGALGTGSVALRLAKGASAELNGTQKLNGISLENGSSLTLSEGSTLELALNTTYLGKGEDAVTTAEIGKGQLSGKGALTLNTGTLSFTDASNLFTNYEGALTVNANAVMAFADTDAFTLAELHGNGTASLAGKATVGDLSDYFGDLKLEGGTQVVFDGEKTKLSGDENAVLDVLSDVTNVSVHFDTFKNAINQVIDQGISFAENISNFSFANTTGQLAIDRALTLGLTENSAIVRNRDTLDNASIESGSELTYNIEKASSAYDLSGISGSGTLALAFGNLNEKLSVSNANQNFNGTFRFDNAKFEIGDKHTGDANNALASNNSLYVGEGSTLVMNGKQTFGKDLTLGSASTLDFTANNGAYDAEGISVNVMNMDGHDIVLAGGDNTLVNVQVNSSIQVEGADTSGSLMNAVRVSDNQDISLVLIDNIKEGSAAGLAQHMQLDDGVEAPETTVTFAGNGTNVADITTSVGIGGNDKQIGLVYGVVTKVSIYDGQTAVLEASGQGDVISAQITNKDGGIGSVHYTGEGSVTLTNSDNDYSGTTTIDGKASVIADANNVLGHSEKVIVGTDSEGSLEVNADQEHLGGLIVNETGALSIADGVAVTINDSTDSKIAGALDGQGTIRLVNSDLTYTTDVEKSLSVAFETDDNSTVTKAGAGKLDFDYTVADLNVTLAEGGLVLDNKDSFGKLNVTQGTEVDVKGLVNIAELTGSGATFNMTVAFGEDANGELQDGRPGLNIQKGSGDHFLNVTAKDLNKGAEERIELVRVQEGDATFALANGAEAITSGGFDYVLAVNAASDGNGTSFILDSQSGPEFVRNTTVTAGSYIGIAYAAQLFDLSLHDRVGNRDWINPVTGEKHSTSLWMHHTVSRESFGDSTGQLKMRSTSNTTMLGGDIVQFTTDNSGLAYAGIMGGYGSMDTKSRSKVTHLRSKAETDAWGVGVYGGWKADSEGQTGPYVDGWLMFTHADSDITGVDRSVESVKGRGLSASLEAGWGFKVASVQTDNGKIANFTVEPHASVTWFGMEYDEIHNEAQDVTFEGKNNVRTRLGTRLIVTEEGNKDFDAFVEANWVHNTQEYGATISGLTVDQAGSRNLGEARIGVDWHVTDSLSVWARAGASYGSDDYHEREGSVGVRYQF